MPNLMLSWDQAAIVGLLLLAVAIGLGLAPTTDPQWQRRTRWTAPLAREAAVIAFLYSAWQYAAGLSENGVTGAFARARWIDRTERLWRLPSEGRLERPLLHHAWLGQSADVYYATMHFTGLFVLLLWMFLRHRENYGRVRTTVAVFTGLSLLIQFIPVAPPRLLPGDGVVDVAAHYGLSVYYLSAVDADTLSAVPSVHVGWALIVGIAPVLYGRGRWRWAAVLYPIVTTWVVVATGNHWWFDGLTAAALLGGVVGGYYAVLRSMAAVRSTRRPAPAQPQLVGAAPVVTGPRTDTSIR